MSELKKLLEGVKVKWMALGEAVNIKRGRRLIKSQLEVKGQYAVFQNSMTPLGYYHEYNVKSDTTFIISAGSAGEIGYLKEEFWAADDVYYFIEPKYLVNKFLYYFLLSKKQIIGSQVRRSSVPRLSKSSFDKLQIPIPCPENPEQSLKIQAEIVRVLDALTEETNALTNELDKELQAHQKQYEYQREELYSFNEQSVKKIPLGNESLGKFIRGSGLQKKDFTDIGVGCIHYGQIYTYYNTFATETKSFVSEEVAKNARKAKNGDLVIATTSENDDDVCKSVAWLGTEDVAISSDACFYHHNVEPLYVAYYFQTEQFQSQKRKYITGTKVRRVNVNDLAKINIPIPSKKEQQKIVKNIVELDTTIQAITKEIKKEIALRNKQCKYYKDLLLTFPKEEA